MLKTLSRGGSRSPTTSMMELLVTIVNSWKSLFIVKRRSFLNVAGVPICHSYLSVIHHFQDFVKTSLLALCVSLYLYNFYFRHKLSVTSLTVFLILDELPKVTYKMALCFSTAYISYVNLQN